MKKLHRKSAVHPTPPGVSNELLYFLPAAMLTLTVALSPEDKEVLSYLISCFSDNHRKSTQKTAVAGGGVNHPPCFNCNCFGCYMSYWVKWDSSPNRQLIHEIIDAFEASLLKEGKKKKSKRVRRRMNGKSIKRCSSFELVESKKTERSLTKKDLNFGGSNSKVQDGGETGRGRGRGGSVEEEDLEKGSVRRFVTFLGDRIWRVWGLRD